ncbi:hypothetical protein [Microbispora rosea]|uniref:hypothetical protein n=1 Tax=Microbispora rosea TaxID=58117 RepID=UPI0013563A2F|nr:hypothetical protein [Microbispora rosea]
MPGLVTVAFDTVAGAGDFVEFEFEFAGEAENVDDATAQLCAFIDGLEVKLGDRVNRGYPHMLLDRDH